MVTWVWAAVQTGLSSFADAAEVVVSGGGAHPPELVPALSARSCAHSARDLAWSNARLRWAVRDDSLARGLLLVCLAASTALASRMLLVAV